MTRRWALALGLALGLALAGCVDIPTDGPVGSEVIGEVEDERDLFVLPDGPQPGASPSQILEGFIAAGRGPQDAYRVAFEFLTDEFRSEWQPFEGVVVTSSPLTPEESAGGGLRLTVAVDAEVDAAGRYSEANAGAMRDLDYAFERDAAGEWRISFAPNGTVLAPAGFDDIFEPYPLYFFDPSYRYLVPDLRWFPPTRSAANRIVSELLAGQSELLAGGVTVSAFPGEVELDGTIEPEAGRAVVPLTAEFASASDLARSRMLQQLEASLRGLRDVASVTISSGGLSAPVPDLEPAADRVIPVEVTPIGMRDGRFGSLAADEVRRLEAIGESVDALRPRGASVARQRDAVAVLGDGGVSIVADGEAVTLDPRPGLVPPSLDVAGYTWSAPAADPAGLVAFASAEEGHELPLAVAGELVSIGVSRDGTRLLAAVDASAGPALLVAGIVRDADLAPVSLGASLDLPIGPGELLGATWVDSGMVAALVDDGETARIVTVTIGGRTESHGSVPDAVAIVGGNGVDGIRVLDADGAVWRPGATRSWVDTGLRAAFLATQQ